MSIFIVVGNMDNLGTALIGDEDDPVDDEDVKERRQEHEMRADWVADELLIAAVRLAASRSTPIWMQADSSYCSLAAFVISEYQSAQIAERTEPIPERRDIFDAPLNLIRGANSVHDQEVDDDWQVPYVQTGVISKHRKEPSLPEALSNSRPSLLICIGAGGTVDYALQQAERMQVPISNLDFSRDNGNGSRQNDPNYRKLLERLVKGRDISLYSREDDNFVEQNRQHLEPERPAQLDRFPPLPLLVYWQLEEALQRTN